MDEVVVRRLCDLHLATKERARVESVRRFEVTIGAEGKSGLPRLVDCCEEHTAQLLGLQELVRNVGQIQHARAVDAAEAVNGCPVCQRQVDAKSVPAHLVNVHGATMPKQPPKCPDCKKPADSPQGMILHRRRSHDYNYRAELMASIPKRGTKK